MDSPVSAAPPPPAGARRAARERTGAIYRIRPDGLWDTMWDSGEDAPYDLVDRTRRESARRHRHRGKDLPRQRRSGACDAAGPRRGQAGHCASPRTLGPHRRRRQQSGKVVRALAVRRRGAARTSPTCAMPAPWRRWGVIRWRAAPQPGEVNVFTRSGNTATPDETWSAWSKPYSNPGGEQIVSPNARYLQWRAVLTASRRAGPGTDVGDDRVPAAKSPAGDLQRSPCIPPGTVFQRPFSTGETGDRRVRGPARRTGAAQRASGRVRRRPDSRPRRPRSDAASIRKAFRRSCGRPTTRTTIVCSSTSCIAARARRAGRCCTASSDRSDFRVGHDVGTRRHLLRQGVGVRRAVEFSGRCARRRARERQLRHRQHRADDRGAAGDARRRAQRRSPSWCATSSRRFSGSEYSLDASRWRLVVSEGRDR